MWLSPRTEDPCVVPGQAWPSTQRVADLHFTSTRVSHTAHGLSVVYRFGHPVYRCLCSHTCPGRMPGTHTRTNAVPMSVSKRVPGVCGQQLGSVKPHLSANLHFPCFEKTQYFLSNSVTKRQATQLKTGKGSEWTVLQRRNKMPLSPQKDARLH